MARAARVVEVGAIGCCAGLPSDHMVTPLPRPDRVEREAVPRRRDSPRHPAGVKGAGASLRDGLRPPLTPTGRRGPGTYRATKGVRQQSWTHAIYVPVCGRFSRSRAGSFGRHAHHRMQALRASHGHDPRSSKLKLRATDHRSQSLPSRIRSIIHLEYPLARTTGSICAAGAWWGGPAPRGERSHHACLRVQPPCAVQPHRVGAAPGGASPRARPKVRSTRNLHSWAVAGPSHVDQR